MNCIGYQGQAGVAVLKRWICFNHGGFIGMAGRVAPAFLLLGSRKGKCRNEMQNLQSGGLMALLGINRLLINFEVTAISCYALGVHKACRLI